MPDALLLGHVVATDLRPSTPHQFHFRAVAGAPAGIGVLVRVDAADRTVFAVITDGAAFSDLVVENTVSQYTAAVLRQIPDEPLQPVPIAAVHLADAADVATALRMDGYTQGDAATGIPVGVYAAGGSTAPVFLDADFLLGPEAAHLNISGVSGLATKTSAVEFLLTAIFQKFPASKGTVAAVCFNVKGPDLCFLDRPAPLSAADAALYAQCGLAAHPFEHVRYYAPPKPDGVNLNTLRTHADLVGDVEPLVWGLREVLDFAEVVMNRDDIDAKADGFIDFLAEQVVGREFVDDSLRGSPFTVESFADLDQFFRAIFESLEKGRGEIWRTHHVATIRKVRNRLGNISGRAKGLVTDDGTPNDLPWGAFTDRSLMVVDVAGVDPLAQDLVFARVISKLREHLERRDLGVDHVIVFVDELGKYAPADGPDTYVRTMLTDVAERGRYLGLVLFSAQQFRSQVLRRVTGNAGTTIYGRMDGDELATAGYQTLSPAIKLKLATLPKGELMVRHPHFAQPVFVRFPRPAVLTGREGVEQYPPAADVPFAEAVVRELKRLDPAIVADRALGLIEQRRDEDVRRALAATRRVRPDDVLGYFTAALGKRVSATVTELRRPVRSARVPDDPYG